MAILEVGESLNISDVYKKTSKEFIQMEKSIRDLLNDFKLVNNYSMQIQYAIDFSHIFDFIFPINVFGSHYGQESELESHQIRIINNHQARSMIFSGFKEMGDLKSSIILLPPHTHELEDMMDMVFKQKINFITETQNLERWGINKFPPEDIVLIEKAYKWFLENPKGLPQKEEWYYDLVKFLEKKYRDVMYVITGYFTNAFRTLSYLFSKEDPRVHSLEKCYPQYSKSIKSLMKNYQSPWLEPFQSFRKKWIANLRDAKSIDILLELNKLLRDEGKKEIVLFISDAKTMRQILEWRDSTQISSKVKEEFISKNLPEGKIKIFDNTIPLLRNTNVFLMYLLFRNEDNPSTLKNLNDALDGISKYLTYGEQISKISNICKIKYNDCANCYNEDECTKIKAQLITHEKYIDSLKNIELMKREKRKVTMSSIVNSSEDLKHDFDVFVKQETNLQNAVESIVRFLKNDTASFEKLVHDEYDKMNSHIENIHKAFQKELGKTMDRYSITLANLLARLCDPPYHPYRIHFQDEAINSLIEAFMEGYQKYENENEIDEKLMMELANQIIEYLESNTGPDRDLLNALLNYSGGKFDQALTFIESNIENEDSILYSEFYYLKLLCNVKIAETTFDIQQFELIYNEISEYYRKYDDIRFLNLMGLIYLRKIETFYDYPISDDNQMRIELISILNSSQELFDLGIQYIEKNEFNKELLPLFHNNYSYSIFIKDIYTDTSTKEERDLAFNRINWLENHYPANHNPNYLDTTVWADIVELKYLIKTSDDKLLIKDKYSNAIAKIDKAILKGRRRQMFRQNLLQFERTKEILENFAIDFE